MLYAISLPLRSAQVARAKARPSEICQSVQAELERTGTRLKTPQGQNHIAVARPARFAESFCIVMLSNERKTINP